MTYGATGDHEGGAVRTALAGDRVAIRRLALACADRRIFPTCLARHPEWIADLLTRYYTDIEPQSSFVAVDPVDGVVGFVLGCRSTARRDREVARRVLPPVVLRAVLSGALLTCPWPRLARRGLRTRHESRRRERALCGPFPAHLHLGVDARVRGRGIGRALLERFTAEVAAAGVAGVHATVLLPDDAGQAFFAACGFRELGRGSTWLPESPVPVVSVLFGRDLEERAR